MSVKRESWKAIKSQSIQRETGNHWKDAETDTVK